MSSSYILEAVRSSNTGEVKLFLASLMSEKQEAKLYCKDNPEFKLLPEMFRLEVYP